MNPPILEFYVQGTPAPGGSKSAFVPRRADGSIVMRKGTNFPVINITDAGGQKNKLWMAVVKQTARLWMRGAAPFECPVKVEFIFFMRRPAAHYRTGKFSHELREDAPKYHTQTPDALKLARSTEDALTSVVWKDDAGNVRICSEKRWAAKNEAQGCAIRIVPLLSEG